MAMNSRPIATYQCVGDSRTQQHYRLFHQRIAGGNHGTDRPHRIPLGHLVNQKPKQCGRKEDAYCVVDAVGITLDKALESFHGLNGPPLLILLGTF
jgi:hypothetical protein